MAPSRQSAVLDKPRSVPKRADKPEPVEIDDPVKFLLDTGLLFEMNRTNCHPVGKSMLAIPGPAGQPMRLSLLDYGNNPVIYIDPETFELGRRKWRTYWREKGMFIYNLRKRLLGITVQTEPDYRTQREKTTMR